MKRIGLILMLTVFLVAVCVPVSQAAESREIDLAVKVPDGFFSQRFDTYSSVVGEYAVTIKRIVVGVYVGSHKLYQDDLNSSTKSFHFETKTAREGDIYVKLTFDHKNSILDDTQKIPLQKGTINIQYYNANIMKWKEEASSSIYMD